MAVELVCPSCGVLLGSPEHSDVVDCRGCKEKLVVVDHALTHVEDHLDVDEYFGG